MLLPLALLALAGPAGRVVLPTRYEAGHFYAVPRTPDGQALKLLVDTGGGGSGGMYWITRAAATRLHLQTRNCTLDGQTVTVARPPAYAAGHGLPPPLDGPCGASLMVNPGDYVVDGQIGAGYLPGRVWTFDYPARRLVLEGAGWRPDPASHPTALGFPRDAGGKPQTGFARITIRIDGQPLDMLLDTGATAHPTAAGKKASGTPTVGDYGVASYITTSMFERWHHAHPRWRVVDKGDDLFGAAHTTRLIEVPRVDIADWSTGPVWFTERPDRAFHDFMSSMMDKRVEGAVGGNVFGHFAMTLDYPAAKAYFRCVAGCTASR
jgi:hypothetical protein